MYDWSGNYKKRYWLNPIAESLQSVPCRRCIFQSPASRRPNYLHCLVQTPRLGCPSPLYIFSLVLQLQLSIYIASSYQIEMHALETNTPLIKMQSCKTRLRTYRLTGKADWPPDVTPGRQSRPRGGLQEHHLSASFPDHSLAQARALTNRYGSACRHPRQRRFALCRLFLVWMARPIDTVLALRARSVLLRLLSLVKDT